MNPEIKYAVTDLLIESNEDLTVLAVAFEEAGASVGFYDFRGKDLEYSFHLVISSVYDDEQVASDPGTMQMDLDALIRVVQKLDGPALELWNSAPFKFLDPLIEVYRVSDSNGAQMALQKTFFDFPAPL